MFVPATQWSTTRKFSSDELQALLDDISTQSMLELVGTLGVDEATVARRLQNIGKMQKTSRCVIIRKKH